MSLSVDMRRLNAALSAWSSATAEEAKKELRTQARVLSMRLMENTQPSPTIRSQAGSAPPTRKQKKVFNDRLQAAGEMKVVADIEKVYDTVPEAAARIKFAPIPKGKTLSQTREQAARAFLGLMRGKTYKRKEPAVTQAEKLLTRLNIEPLIRTKIGSFDGGTAHQQARFGPKQRVPKNQYVRTVVTDPPALEKYKEQRMVKVGVVKAAWAECARQLGGTQTVRGGGTGGWSQAVALPSWVKRHLGKYNKGTVTQALESDKPYIEMTNRVSYVKENISDQTIAETVSAQVQRLINRLGYISRAAARKARMA